MSTIFEFFHHDIRSHIPLTFRFVDVRSIPFFLLLLVRGMTHVHAETFFVIRDFSEFERRSFEFSFVCPINVVEHRHEDDSIFKFFWTCLTSVQIFLDL